MVTHTHRQITGMWSAYYHNLYCTWTPTVNKLKYFVLASKSNESSILGSGKTLSLYLTQRDVEPSFLATSIMGLVQGLDEGIITSCCNISSMSSMTLPFQREWYSMWRLSYYSSNHQCYLSLCPNSHHCISHGQSLLSESLPFRLKRIDHNLVTLPLSGFDTDYIASSGRQATGGMD